MDEYHPCKKADPTAREAIGNIMRLVRAQNRKKNKYNARKTTVCGYTFDSRREAEIYLDLLSRKQAGGFSESDCNRSTRSLKASRIIRGTGRKRLPTRRISS